MEAGLHDTQITHMTKRLLCNGETEFTYKTRDPRFVEKRQGNWLIMRDGSRWERTDVEALRKHYNVLKNRLAKKGDLLGRAKAHIDKGIKYVLADHDLIQALRARHVEDEANMKWFKEELALASNLLGIERKAGIEKNDALEEALAKVADLQGACAAHFDCDPDELANGQLIEDLIENACTSEKRFNIVKNHNEALESCAKRKAEHVYETPPNTSATHARLSNAVNAPAPRRVVPRLLLTLTEPKVKQELILL